MKTNRDFAKFKKPNQVAVIPPPEPEAELPPEIRAFKINMSKGDPIACDPDELSKIILAIKTNQPCIIRSGLFNPSYYVTVTLDKERVAEGQRINSQIYKDNEHDLRYNHGKNQIVYKGLEPLKDIFAGIDLKVRPNHSQQLLNPNGSTDTQALDEPAEPPRPVLSRVWQPAKGRRNGDNE